MLFFLVNPSEICVCNSLYQVQNKPVFNVSSIPTLFIVFHISSTPWLCWLYLSQTVLRQSVWGWKGKVWYRTSWFREKTSCESRGLPSLLHTDRGTSIHFVSCYIITVYTSKKKKHENFVFWDVWGGELDWKVTHLLFLFTVIRKFLLPHIYMWLNNKWQLCSCFPVSVLCEISSFPSFTAGNEEAKSHGKLVDWSSDAFE